MTGKIIINAERCKGCGLCVKECPKGNIVISEDSNKAGYFPAREANKECTGCSLCALICPEAVIEVLREKSIKIKEINDSKKKSQLEMIEGKK